MTWEEWVGVLEDVAAKWGRLGHLPEVSQQQYFGDLADLPVELVLSAVEAVYRSGEKYPPHGYRIRIVALEIDSIATAPAVERSETPELSELWTSIWQTVERTVPEDVRNMWLGLVRPYALEAPFLYLEAPRSQCDWIRRRFVPILLAAAKEVDAGVQRVEFVPSAKLDEEAGKSPDEPDRMLRAPSSGRGRQESRAS